MLPPESATTNEPGGSPNPLGAGEIVSGVIKPPVDKVITLACKDADTPAQSARNLIHGIFIHSSCFAGFRCLASLSLRTAGGSNRKSSGKCAFKDMNF